MTTVAPSPSAVVHRPATEQRLEKHLIKTGVTEVDEELLLASLCLVRIEKKYNQDFENKIAREVAAAAANYNNGNSPSSPAADSKKHYVENTVGGIVDATGRGEMGSRPEDLLHSKDAILHRTDVTVANGAIRRVANAAATALHELDACRAELEFLRAKTTSQEIQIEQQSKQLQFLQSQLDHFSSPEAIYEAFKSVWEAEAIAGKEKTESAVGAMKHQMTEMERHKATAALLSKEAVARQQILDDTSDKTLAVVGEINVAKIGALFQEKKARGRNGGDDDDDADEEHEPIDIVDTRIGVTEMEGEVDLTHSAAILSTINNSNTAAASAAGGDGGSVELSAATQKMLAEQARQCDYHVNQRVAKFSNSNHSNATAVAAQKNPNAIKNARQAAEAIMECDNPVQFSRQTDALHFVIRRSTTDKSHRVIRMEGSSTSIVGKLTSAILYSPAETLQIQVDMKSTLGRKAQLQIQAEELHLTEVWNELCLYSRPYLNVVHFKINKSLELQSKKKDFDVRPLVIDALDLNNSAVNANGGVIGETGVVEFEEKRKQQEKRLAFKRLEESIITGRDGGEHTISTHQHYLANHKNSDEHLEFMIQIPGIIGYIARKRGKQIIRDRQRKAAQQLADSSAAAAGGSPSTFDDSKYRQFFDEDDLDELGQPIWHDPVELGAIRVFASSIMKPAQLVNIVKPFRDRHSNFFSTKDEPGQYIEISFENMSVLPTGYSLSCTHPINGCHFPRHWRIDASADRIKWSTLHRHVNDESLNRYSPTWAWSLPREAQQSSFYSYFRIVNEGLNASGNDALCVSSFEVYGKLVYITNEMAPTKMSNAAISNDRPKMFMPMVPLPIQKETKPTTKKAAKKR